jgi:hypothetical protein
LQQTANIPKTLQKKRSRTNGTAGMHLAADTAQLAQELPDRAAIEVAAGVAVEEEHLAVPPCVDLSREDNKIVTDL